jgi:hypothetical protein
VLEPNIAGVEKVRLDFNTALEAILSVRRWGRAELWRIGLDGRYRPSPDGLARRGYWADEQTFTFEVFEIGPQVAYYVRVDGEHVQISAPELGLQWEGRIGLAS